MSGNSPVRTAEPRFLDVLRIPMFQAIYGAELQSGFGDQLARVALSVLVYALTGSDAATALTYALTYLPAIVGGVVLARVGDRWPRRRVMVGCDLLRAAMFAAMSIRGLPLVVVGALLCVAVFVGPAFSASASSYLAAELNPGEFRAAAGVRMSTSQMIQVVGFGAGGALVAVLGARETLLLNAATYVVSATALTWGLRGRERDRRVDLAADPADAADAGVPASGAAGADGARRDGVLVAALNDVTARTMLFLALLAGLFVVPESLAIPFAGQIGATTTQAGLLLASIPLGATSGILVVTRLVPAHRRAIVAWTMAIASGAPLIVTAVTTRLLIVAVCWFASGVASAYIVEAVIVLVNAAPDASRARLLSLVSSLLLGAQGIGPIAFGGVASLLTPAAAVAWAGAVAVVVAAVIVVFALSGTGRTGMHRAGR